MILIDGAEMMVPVPGAGPLAAVRGGMMAAKGAKAARAGYKAQKAARRARKAHKAIKRSRRARRAMKARKANRARKARQARKASRARRAKPERASENETVSVFLREVKLSHIHLHLSIINLNCLRWINIGGLYHLLYGWLPIKTIWR